MYKDNFRTYHFSNQNKNYVFDGENMRICELLNNRKDYPTKINDNKNNSEDKKFLRNIVLNLTNNCNLKCGYCYANKGKYDNPNAVMDFEIAKRSIDLVIESIIKNNGKIFSVGFFGGEPLIAFKQIKRICNYIKAIKPKDIKVRYLLTTNGTLFTNDNIDFFIDKPFKITISIDGNKNANDFYRKYNNGKGTYDDIIKNIELFDKKKPLTARLTINDKNTNIKDQIEHLVSIGFKKITYASDYDLNDHFFALYLSSLKDFINWYKLQIKCGNYFNVTNITKILNYIIFKKKLLTHCNAGISYLSVSADGKFYRCPRFTGIKKFSVGNVKDTDISHLENSINNFKKKLKNNVSERVPECNTCAFVYLCGGMCYHHAYKTNGNEFNTISRECNYRLYTYKLIIEMLCDLTFEERKNFIAYLNTHINEEYEYSFKNII